MRKLKKKRVKELVYLILIAVVALFSFSMCKKISKNNNYVDKITPAMNEASEAIQTSQDTLDKTEQTEDKRKLITDVPHISQNIKYPTGCESVSAVSLMQFYNVNITVEDFIDNHLPTAACPYDDGNATYGQSPWNYFIGDPYSNSGYGCYSTVIAKAMRSVLSQNFEIRAIYNVPLSNLCTEYIDNGHPVLIWATMDMKEPYGGMSWILPNGENFTFIRPEHALVLIGYDDTSYYFCNPQSDVAVVSYPKAACEIAYNALYSQAIVMQPIS